MPRVPQFHPDDVASPMPGARFDENAPIEAFGGGQSLDRLNQAEQGITSDVGKIIEQEKKRADDAAIQLAYAKANQLRNDLFWNPTTGAMAHHGQDAIGITDKVLKSFDDGALEISKGLNGSDQQEHFQSIARQQRDDIDAQLHRHEFQESKVVEKQSFDSAIASTISDGILNYQQPGKLDTAKNVIEGLVRDYSQKNGYTAPMYQEERQKTLSAYHSGVINKMSGDGDDKGAQQYFTANRQDFTGQDAIKMDKVVGATNVQQESLRQSDAIFAHASDMSDAIAQARKIGDADTQDEVIKRLKDRYALQKTAQEDSRQQNFTSASNIVEQTKDPDQIPRAQWLGLTITERNQIEERAKRLREGAPTATDWPTYYELKTMGSKDSERDQFLRTNLMQYRNRLDDSKFKELIDIQAAMKKGDTKADQGLAGFRASTLIVNDALTKSGINPFPKASSSDAQNVANFRRMVDEQSQVLQDRTGKAPGDSDVQNIVDNLMVKGVARSGIFSNYKVPLFEAKPGETINIQANDIPAGERVKIDEALKSRGLPVTNENAVRLYSMKAQKLVTNGK